MYNLNFTLKIIKKVLKEIKNSDATKINKIHGYIEFVEEPIKFICFFDIDAFSC